MKEGQGIETLGTVLAWAGWLLAVGTTIVGFNALREWMRFSDDGALVVLLGTLVTLVLCLALAGLGHLLRATAQLGRNLRRVHAAIAAQRP